MAADRKRSSIEGSLSNDTSGQPEDSKDRAPPLALLHSMGGHEFEDFVEVLLQKMGFHIEGRQPAADGGIDLIARHGDAIVGGKYVIQCKRYSSAVGNAAVRDLYGVVHAELANKGVLVTTSTFTKEARRFAEGKPIELIDGQRLQELLMQHGLFTSDYSSARKKLSPGIQLVYSQMVNPLARILAESENVASGLVYIPRDNVDRSRYNRIVQRHIGQHLGLTSLSPLLERAQTILNNYDPSPEELSQLQSHNKELLSMARTLLKIQKEAQSLIPPPELSRLHELYVQISPAVLRRFWNFASGVKDLVEGRFSGSKLDLSIDLNVPELAAVANELALIQASRREPQGSCFIATAAYGSEMEPSVEELRQFRNAHLLPYAWGRSLVAIYEATSPFLARVIRQNESTKSFVRTLLVPFVIIAKLLNRLSR